MMLRLFFAVLAFLWVSLLRPDDPPPDDDGDNDDSDDDDSNDNEPKDSDKPGVKFTQDDVDRIVSERLEREKRKSEREKEESERKAREDALKEQGKYKEIAEQHAATIGEKDKRIQELESAESERDEFKQKYEDLEGRYAKLIEDRLSVVPEPFKPLLKAMSVTERADWLENNSEKLTEYGNGKPKGSRPTGKPGKTGDDEPSEAAVNSQRQTTSSAF